MDLLDLFFIFILGAIVGSFLNVVILRYNTGMSISRGRSKCFSCNLTLKWYEMLPVVSYFYLRGKCRSCKSPISLQYPIVEFLMGLIFVGSALRQYSLWPIYSNFQHGLAFSVLFFIYYVVTFGLLVVIMVYDIKHKVIPNSFVYTFIFLGLLKLFAFAYLKGFSLEPIDVLDLFTPLILFTPLAFLWFISDGRWIGFGDAKLVFGIGAVLGFVSGLGAAILAFWIGAVWSIGFLLYDKIFRHKSKNINLNTEIPFAPFLIIATLIVFLTRVDVLNLRVILDLFY